MNKFESDFLKLAYPIGILCAIGCTLVAYSLTVAWTNSSDVDLGVTYIGIPDWNNNGKFKRLR